jgi:hypothetical protein
MKFTIWVAEGENGSVQFDTQPSVSDVLNATEDLDGTIEVYEVRAVQVSKYRLFVVGRV